MRAVRKYLLPPATHTQTLRFPGASVRFLHVDMQGDAPVLWVEVDPDSEKAWDITLTWFGTGHEIPGNALYVGTVQDGAFVFHLYEVTS